MLGTGQLVVELFTKVKPTRQMNSFIMRIVTFPELSHCNELHFMTQKADVVSCSRVRKTKYLTLIFISAVAFTFNKSLEERCIFWMFDFGCSSLAFPLAELFLLGLVNSPPEASSDVLFLAAGLNVESLDCLTI